MDSGPLRLRPVGHLLIVVSLAMAGVIVTLPTRSVAAGSTSPGIAGEKLVISGQLSSRGKRPVVLQRYLQKRWIRVTASRTSSRGRYSFVVIVPNRSASYRVVAPRTRIAGQVRAAKIFKVRRITVRAQSATLAFPSVVVEGRPTAVRTSFSPARPGRPVALQKLIDGVWVSAATTVQDAAGRATFTVEQHDTTTYRAITVPWRGAAARGTAPRTAGVTPPPPSGPWVTGYYAGWFWDQMYPSEQVDMSAMTPAPRPC